MPVDKFGRYVSRKREGERSLQRDWAAAARGGLKFTPEGDYDVGLKRLRHLADPEEDDDGCTKRFVLEKVKEVSCEDVLKANSNFYTNRIDPLLRKVQSGVAILEPLLLSYQQGQILSLPQIESKLKEQKLEYEGIVRQTITQLTENHNKNLAELKGNFLKFGPFLHSYGAHIPHISSGGGGSDDDPPPHQ